MYGFIEIEIHIFEYVKSEDVWVVKTYRKVEYIHTRRRLRRHINWKMCVVVVE